MARRTLEYTFFQYPCDYGANYTAKLLEINGEIQKVQTVPSFIRQDTRSGLMSVYTNDEADAGWYLIEVTAVLDVLDNLGDLDPNNDPDTPQNFLNTFLYDPNDPSTKIYAKEKPPPDLVYTTSFNVTVGIIVVNSKSIIADNSAPFMLPPPGFEEKVIAGEEWLYELGRVYDFEEDNVVVTASLGNAAKYVEFDSQALTLYIKEGATSR